EVLPALRLDVVDRLDTDRLDRVDELLAQRWEPFAGEARRARAVELVALVLRNEADQVFESPPRLRVAHDDRVGDSPVLSRVDAALNPCVDAEVQQQRLHAAREGGGSGR